jgi:hypothetical protein
MITSHDLVVSGAAPAAGQLESITDLDTLDGLDSHQRTR